ncbi:MAG: branched-chain-amino-acid transaminase [Phycisphaerales bacterium]|nr:branched-chain-amino-acid transaminase [Phycisphaerales bacterium]
MTQASVSSSLNTAAAADRPFVWVNGQMLPRSQAAVNVFDHGLLYGDGIFEGIRVYKGRIFKARQHMERLYQCADQIFLKIPYTPDEMIAIQRECIEINNLKEGYIRLVVTRGVGTLGLNPYTCPEAGVICIADQISLYKPEMYEKGMRVVVANRPRIPVACLDPRIKSLNYLNNILAKCEAIHITQKLGITKPEDMLLECIMLNLQGNVSEGSGDNVFIVKDGVVITPPPDAGILEGITRRFVLETLCPQLGIKAAQRDFTLPDLLQADEVFLTGSAAEIIAVREVLEHEGEKITRTHHISAGEGPITGKLRRRFREIVTSDHIPED